MSVNTNVSRQRATLACNTCRSRRTKCDGRRPTCLFCEEHGMDCTYRNPSLPAASRQETEITAIRERLDHIHGLLSLRAAQSRLPGNSTELQTAQLSEYPWDESIISRNWRREFPFMTIQTPSMMCLLGLDSRLAAQLVVLERTDVATMIKPVATLDFVIEYHNAIDAFESFYNKVHYWYPLLPQDFFDMYQEIVVRDLEPSTQTFLVLIVLAIGTVMQCPTIAEAYLLRPDSKYIGYALSMLPNVHFEFSLRSVQCLVLLSVYYKLVVKPCQAHDYILIASCKAQALFKCHLYDDDNATMELLRRCFWSILLIESELAYHIDMPESNIWKFDDRILLPGTLESWQPFSTKQRNNTRELRSSHTLGMPPEAGKAYFLAVITMCRMVRRCTTSVTISHDREVYAPIIAAELTLQLESWYDHLPWSIRFEREGTISQLSEELGKAPSPENCSPLTAATRFLRMQYFLCLTGIYWPAVYSVIYMDTLAGAPVADCAQFFESYSRFVMSAVLSLSCCRQNTWSIYASLFITTMAAMRGARAPSIRHTISPAITRCFEVAAESLENPGDVSISPSLRTISAILRNQVEVHIKSEMR